MDGRDFFDRVETHPGLEWLGARPGPTAAGDEVLVGRTGGGTAHAVAVSEVLRQPWEELEGVLTGAREPRVMTHITRIVGYFSQVHNWNRSKLAELGDRHLGDYAVPETQAVSAGRAGGRPGAAFEGLSRRSRRTARAAVA
jgi:hypothetical protein